MARDWINSNNGQGNVLKCKGSNLIEASANVTLDANINIIQVELSAAAVALTGVIGSAFIGDQAIIVARNTTGGTLALSLAGDFAAGSVDVGAGGVASIVTVYNGENFAGTATLV